MKNWINKRLKNSRGMTLVEVIVGIALLGIVSAMILMVFTTGMMLAANAGDNTLVTGETISKTNDVIVDYDATPTGAQQATILFEGDTVGSEKAVDGNLINESASSDKNESNIKTFVPVKEKL